MKKWLAAASGAGLTMALVAGCGTAVNRNVQPGGAAKTQTTTGINPNDVKGQITVLTHRTDLQADGTLARYAKEFKKLYPHVTRVDFQAITNYANDVKVRLNSGNYGDVLMIPGGVTLEQMPQFFVPLDNLGLDDKVYFGHYDAYQGKTYGLPSGVDTNGLIYNKIVFRKAGIQGPPRTLNEFYQDCAKIKKLGVTPIALNYEAQWPLGVWDQLAPVIANNPNYFNTWKNVQAPFKLGSPVAKNLNIAYTIVHHGWAEPDFKVTDWEGSKSQFAQGKIGMFLLGNWAINQFESKGIASKNVGFAPFPYDNSGHPNALIGPDYFYGVSKNSHNIPTAEAWVKFMIEKSGYAQSGGFIPPLKSQKPSLPQLKEFEGYKPKLLQSVPADSTVTQIQNAAQIDIGGGGYVQSVLTAPSFAQAMTKLNQAWQNGMQQVGLQ
ncbi:MAG: ABC transporter substrate-binding protein [Alicyclobacillus sp.]|nr:ABC transporter substrate-binding protein [Alicyclobacillus sp.]